jgi:hypothetical protein
MQASGLFSRIRKRDARGMFKAEEEQFFRDISPDAKNHYRSFRDQCYKKRDQVEAALHDLKEAAKAVKAKAKAKAADDAKGVCLLASFTLMYISLLIEMTPAARLPESEIEDDIRYFLKSKEIDMKKEKKMLSKSKFGSLVVGLLNRVTTFLQSNLDNYTETKKEYYSISTHVIKDVFYKRILRIRASTRQHYKSEEHRRNAVGEHPISMTLDITDQEGGGTQDPLGVSGARSPARSVTPRLDHFQGRDLLSPPTALRLQLAPFPEPKNALLLGMFYSEDEGEPKRGQQFRDAVRCQSMETLGYTVYTLDGKHEPVKNKTKSGRHCNANFASSSRRLTWSIIEVWKNAGIVFDVIILDYFFSPVRRRHLSHLTRLTNITFDRRHGGVTVGGKNCSASQCRYLPLGYLMKVDFVVA